MTTLSQYQLSLSAADLLEAAALALAIPTVWGKGAFARRSDGVAVNSDNPKACTFCSVGAVSQAAVALNAGAAVQSKARAALNQAARDHRLGGAFSDIMDFNDSRNRKEPVLEVFGKAIDTLRGL